MVWIRPSGGSFIPRSVAGSPAFEGRRRIRLVCPPHQGDRWPQRSNEDEPEAARSLPELPPAVFHPDLPARRTARGIGTGWSMETKQVISAAAPPHRDPGRLAIRPTLTAKLH
ncbi:hypothetical protein Psuf_063990 [Phytohabitans suffuscus]|uniref:Uncharacterized protein n=1 Tax=Phytohabitans suffuscus TaxID=624315 RepID=A0A6F8YSP6_9ACTN|nr:hypothetical protein Psuf_063990 [Phytohabitans suffuscus]